MNAWEPPKKNKQLVIAVCAGKGGVGKTTSACGLASVFADQAKNVLVIDFDAQGNSTWGLGADPTAEGAAEFLLGQSPPPSLVAPGLSVLAPGPMLESESINRLPQEALLDALHERAPHYDVVLVDCPRGNPHLDTLALVAAEKALICIDAHPFAFQGALKIIEHLKSRRAKGRLGARKWALVLARILETRKLDRTLIAEVASMPDLPHFLVHQDQELANATGSQLPVMQAAPNTQGVKDLKTITEWLSGESEIQSSMGFGGRGGESSGGTAAANS